MTMLTILPSGILYAENNSVQSSLNDEDILVPALRSAFEEGVGKVLLELGCIKQGTKLPSLLGYWQKFSNLYMAYRCRLEPDWGEQKAASPLDTLDFVPLPELENLVNNPPTMRGAEYFSQSTLIDAWQQIDAQLRDQVNEQELSLNGFLQQFAPHWHQVGRICLHLAENKQDPDYPFAFMATYISELNTQGNAKYLPLSQALKQFSKGRHRKAELIRLLSRILVYPTIIRLLNLSTSACSA